MAEDEEEEDGEKPEKETESESKARRESRRSIIREASTRVNVLYKSVTLPEAIAPNLQQRPVIPKRLIHLQTEEGEDPLAIPKNPFEKDEPKTYKCGNFLPKLRHHRPMYKPAMPPYIQPQV